MAEYKHLLTRQELPRRIIVAAIFLSCTFAPYIIRAQSHEESCDATRVLFEQAQLDIADLQLEYDFKVTRPDYWRGNLSTLNKAITNNNLIPRMVLEPWARAFAIDLPEEGRMTVAQRFELQRSVRSAINNQFQTVALLTTQAMVQRLKGLVNQQTLQFNRLQSLKCKGFVSDPEYKPTEPSRFSLTGTWKCDDGGTYVLQQFGSILFWEATSPDGGQTWAHRFEGNIEGNEIKGSFKDHPPGAIRQTGDLVFKIINNNQVERTYTSVGYGCNHLARQ
jgi:hypothetical protein